MLYNLVCSAWNLRYLYEMFLYDLHSILHILSSVFVFLSFVFKGSRKAKPYFSRVSPMIVFFVVISLLILCILSLMYVLQIPISSHPIFGKHWFYSILSMIVYFVSQYACDSVYAIIGVHSTNPHFIAFTNSKALIFSHFTNDSIYYYISPNDITNTIISFGFTTLYFTAFHILKPFIFQRFTDDSIKILYFH